MNWKEFFKPSIIKIIIAIIISLFIPISSEMVCDTYVDGAGGCYSSYLQAYEVFTGKIAWYVLPLYPVFYLAFLLSYTISCLVVFIYHKFKKQNAPNT